MTGSDLADWWDSQNRQSKEILEEWVEENPQWWAIGIATTVATFQDLGAGIVDMARIGEGTAEGGWGYGKDALRLIGLAGPSGRGVRYLAKGTGVGVNRLLALADPGGDICTYIAANHLLRRTAARLFVSVDDLAKGLNIPIPKGGVSKLDPKFGQDFVNVLKRLGGRVKELSVPTKIRDVEQAVRKSDGVVMFGIKWLNAAGKWDGHTVYAFKNSLGQIRYSDRYGKVFNSIEGFKSTFGGTNYEILAEGSWNSMVLVEGARILKLPSGMATLALAVSKLLVANENVVDTPTLVNSFEGKKKIVAGQKPTLPQRPAVQDDRLPPVEYLTGVQARLNNLGYGAGPVDGINGRRTKRAVRLFQQHTPPLRVDEIPGPNTQAKLLEAHGC